MNSPARYWRTMRHLKPRQITARVWFRSGRPRPDQRPAPALRRVVQPFQPFPLRMPSMTGSRSFVFLNQEARLDPATPLKGWDDPQRSKLWRYHLHYFDDLNAQQSAKRRDWHHPLIKDWMQSNPPGVGSGWEPYPTSLRIVNWIKAAQAGFGLSPDACQSLAVQARWLSSRVEHHLSGNHLLANAKALYFCGLFFEGVEADGWQAQALRIFRQELPEQILSDGGHYELSPMYHALVLEDLLDLVNLMRSYRVQGELQTLIRPRILPMLKWLRLLSHPDKDIAFFNDAAIGVAPSHRELETYAASLGFVIKEPVPLGLTHLAHSGYLHFANDNATVLIDVGPVGPRHQPGHAHADTLSFELSGGAQRILVNGGTSEYGMGPERQRQRGTAAHNTVALNGIDSSEVWAGFRVGQRARIHGLEIDQSAQKTRITAGHDGYRHLAGKPVHMRSFIITPNEITVSDQLGSQRRRACAYYHFAPGLSLNSASNGTRGEIRGCDDQLFLRWEVIEGKARLIESTHHPGFGQTLASTSLCIMLENNRAALRLLFPMAPP